MRGARGAAVGGLVAALWAGAAAPAAAAPAPVPTVAPAPAPPPSAGTAGTGGGTTGESESAPGTDPGLAGTPLFAPGAAVGLTDPVSPLAPVPGPHPSQDDGERAEMGGSGLGTPLALGGVALLLCGAGLARFLHGRRARKRPTDSQRRRPTDSQPR